MKDTSKPFPQKSDNWVPLFLIALPATMAIQPLVTEVSPRLHLFMTPALPIAFLIALVLYAFVTGAARPLWRRPPPRAVLAAAAPLAAIALFTSVFVAPQPVFSSIKLAELSLYLLACLFAARIFERGGRRLMRSTLAALFLSVVIAVPLTAVLTEFRIPDYYMWPLFIPGFDYIRIYGFALTAAIALGTGFLALPDSRQPALKWGIVFCLCLLWTALFWTSSRGGILALIAVAPVLAILIPAFRRTLPYFLLAMIIGAIVSAPIESDIQDIGFVNTFAELQEPVPLAGTGAGRMEEWKVALGAIAERPFFGHGLAQAYFVVPTQAPHVHVHNIVLEALLAWGILGAACAGFLIIRFWMAGLKIVNDEALPERIPAFYTISVLLVYAWLDATYLYYQALIPLFLCTSVMVAKPGAE